MSYPISRGLLRLAAERRRDGQLLRWIPTWLRGAIGELLLRTLVLRHAHMVVVQSERMRTELAAEGFDPARLLPVPMGVDLQAVEAALRVSPPVEFEERRVVGYLGTLDRPRRIELLLEMTALLKAEVPEVLLLLVGDTRDTVHRAALDRRIRELKLRTM